MTVSGVVLSSVVHIYGNGAKRSVNHGVASISLTLKLASEASIVSYERGCTTILLVSNLLERSPEQLHMCIRDWETSTLGLAGLNKPVTFPGVKHTRLPCLRGIGLE